MASKGSKYFIEKNGQILVNVPYLEAYLPMGYFNRNINSILGDKAQVFGLFSFRVGNDKGEITKNSPVEIFNFPSMMITQPDSMEKRSVQLHVDGESENYFVFRYIQGQPMMVTNKVVKSVANQEYIMDDMMGARLPKNIKYSDLPKIIFKNFEINGALGIQALVISTSFSMLARSKTDGRAFRFTANSNNELDYVLNNARNVCANESTMAAITFEDTDYMLASSISRKRMGMEQTKTPLEKLIT